jgi:hypothetical protein
MTWTQINPDKFSQYEGMTPVEIGVKVRPGHTVDLLKKQDIAFHSIPNYEPWHYEIDNSEWMDFWKDAYALKNKDRETWTDEDWFMYVGLDTLLLTAMVSTQKD